MFFPLTFCGLSANEISDQTAEKAQQKVYQQFFHCISPPFNCADIASISAFFLTNFILNYDCPVYYCVKHFQKLHSNSILRVKKVGGLIAELRSPVYLISSVFSAEVKICQEKKIKDLFLSNVSNFLRI